MAYKFQLGGAKLSGSITQTDGTFITAQSELRIGNAQLTETELEMLDGISAGTVVASKAIVVDGNKDASGMRNLGATQLSASADVLAGGAVIATELTGALANSLSAGNGINTLNFDNTAAGVVQLKLNTSNPGLEVDSNGLKAKLKSESGGTISVDGSGMFIDDSAIANAKLANSAVTVGTTSISLGASSTTLAGMTGIDYAAGNRALGASIGANTLTIGGATSTVAIAGDLTVAGTFERVSSTELLIEDKTILIASGSTTKANSGGAALIVPHNAAHTVFSQIVYKVNGENVGGVDASSSGDIFQFSGSAGLVDVQAAAFYGDGANLSGVVAGAVQETVASKAADYTLNETSETIILANAGSGDVTLTLPAASGKSGTMFKVKRIDDGSSNDVFIAPASGEKLEFVTNGIIMLESQGSAVSLLCNGTDWFVL